MLAHARPFKHQSLIPDCETLEDDTLQALDVMEVYLYVWVFLRSFFFGQVLQEIRKKNSHSHSHSQCFLPLLSSLVQSPCRELKHSNARSGDMPVSEYFLFLGPNTLGCVDSS